MTMMKESVDRLTTLIDAFAETLGEDRIEFLKYQVEIEKRFGVIERSIAVSETKLLIYGGLGGTIGGAIIGAIVYGIFSP